MTRFAPLAVVLMLCGLVRAEETEKDFRAVTVDSVDVAAVTTQKQTRGTRVRVRLLQRGNGEVIRIGVARTIEAGVSAMTIVSLNSTKASFTETVSTDGFVAVAAGPKESAVTLEKIEADPATAGATNLSFAGGMVVQVVLTPRVVVTQPATQATTRPTQK